MPPPPPPSKSYLLVFDTSSSEDDADAESESNIPTAVATAVPTAAVTPVQVATPLAIAEAVVNSGNNANVNCDGEDDSIEDTATRIRGASICDDDGDQEGDKATAAHGRVDDNDNDADDDEGDDDGDIPKKKRKKKKKKKSKKKSKRKNASSGRGRRGVSFGTVSVLEFKRSMGTDAVPADGGWPLGLSNDLVNDFSAGTIDDFENRRQVELRTRYVSVMEKRRDTLIAQRRAAEESHGHGHGHHGHGGNKPHGHHGHHHQYHGGGRRAKKDKHHGHHTISTGSASGGGKSTNTNTAGTAKGEAQPSPPPSPVHAPIPVPDGFLETRQFDYKKRKKPQDKSPTNSANDEIDVLVASTLLDGKNPLFGPTSNEDDRMHLLLRDSEPRRDDDNNDAHAAAPSDDHHLVAKMPSSPTLLTGRRQRSHSNVDQIPKCPPSPNRGGSSGGRRLRSQSNADRHFLPNDVYSHTEVLHVRNELEQIRNFRSGEGSAGCTCRKLHVVLPDHGGEQHGKKHKHKHRRLTERKVKEELRKRGLLHGSGRKSREELEILLHDAVEKEPCCWGSDCPCVHNGINCQADTCSCWYPGHHSGTGGGGGSSSKAAADLQLSVEEVQQKCGNRNGMYVVNFRQINASRRLFTTAAAAAAAATAGRGGDAVPLVCLPAVGESS